MVYITINQSSSSAGTWRRVKKGGINVAILGNLRIDGSEAAIGRFDTGDVVVANGERKTGFLFFHAIMHGCNDGQCLVRCNC
jgi:hypothetical protein